MALQEQGLNFNFAQGLDTKSDPWQVPNGRMLALDNSVFTKAGMLTKRNGFGALTLNPDLTAIYTHENGLLGTTGQAIQTFAQGPKTWQTVPGVISPTSLSVLPLSRAATSQVAIDSVVADNGLICTVIAQNGSYFYLVSDSGTGNLIIPATPITGTHPKVFLLAQYFVITSISTGGSPAIGFMAVPTVNPSSPVAFAPITTSVSSSSANHTGIVANNRLYLFWNASDPGGAIRYLAITSTLQVTTMLTLAGESMTLSSCCTDLTGTTPNIYLTYWNSGTLIGKTFGVDWLGTQILAPTSCITTHTLSNLTSCFNLGSIQFVYQINATYTGGAVRSDAILTNSVTPLGGIGTEKTIGRGFGLSSQVIAAKGKLYFALAFVSAYQPTYFLAQYTLGNTSLDIVAKWAYSNGNGYLTTGYLPTLMAQNNILFVVYSFKTSIQSQAQTSGVNVSTPVFLQTGVNLAKIQLFVIKPATSEIASTLHFAGGRCLTFDGQQTVEQNFDVFPDDITVSTATGSGGLTAQQYYYQVIYTAVDLSGNIHRSTPSVPIQVTTTTSSSTNTLIIPTYRIPTVKIVQINIYRWSTAQQQYFQVTSLSSPLLNDPTVNDISFIDTLADSAILGNPLIYTTGGVLENVAPPANYGLTLFKSRMWLVDAESPNRLWYSKLVSESTPVQFSDLQTVYVAPTQGAQGSTGDVTALSSIDDKLIVFKAEAIYYFVGDGPGAAGGGSTYSDPVFITSAVGCINQASTVLTPQGIMFQSSKGIWLLDRGLNTSYIGAPVEFANLSTVLSATSIPGTTQVRFAMSSGQVLMYDYYYQQWGTFSGVPMISSVLYMGEHTYLAADHTIRQETPGFYLDNATPVLVSFTTAWLKVAGLQGFQRAKSFYLLSNYLTPHKLQIDVAYDYNSAPTQSSIILPTNKNTTWGSDALWGSGEVWGGGTSVEQWRVFLKQQKCQALQITISEVYDPTKGIKAGAGLTMSGLNLTVAGKLSRPKPPTSGSVG